MYLPLRDAESGSSAGAWKRIEQSICAVFVVVFVVYSLNFAYLFVDDEAIPFVYAQNVLRGNGLVYNPDDGRVEGYSDFLSIWIDVAILGLVTVAGASKLWAFALADLFAFGCAIALIVVTFAILRKRSKGSPLPIVAGMAFVTLAGPLAVWSWSALETTLFALIAVVLVAALLEIDRSDRRNDRYLLACVVALMFCRIDGSLWGGALVAPFFFSVPRWRRRELVTRVILPATAAFAVYPRVAHLVFSRAGADARLREGPVQVWKPRDADLERSLPALRNRVSRALALDSARGTLPRVRGQLLSLAGGAITCGRDWTCRRVSLGRRGLDVWLPVFRPPARADGHRRGRGVQRPEEVAATRSWSRARRLDGRARSHRP